MLQGQPIFRYPHWCGCLALLSVPRCNHTFRGRSSPNSVGRRPLVKCRVLSALKNCCTLPARISSLVANSLWWHSAWGLRLPLVRQSPDRFKRNPARSRHREGRCVGVRVRFKLGSRLVTSPREFNTLMKTTESNHEFWRQS